VLSTLLLALFAFVLSLVFTPLLRDLARHRGWVDEPDNSRKTHRVPTPRLGGLAVVLAYVGSFGILLLWLKVSPAVQSSFPLFWRLLPATAVVFAIGVLDDFFNLNAWLKLLGQTFAAVLACSSGVHIESLGGSPLGGFVGVPLTIIWLVGCANAFNLIDGLDGLAGGLGLLASLATLAAGLLYHDASLVTAMAPLVGALLGFLIFNFSPASIFLGDGGSLWIGFMLGCYAVIWSQDSTTVPGATAPLVALCIPLLDTALSIARRFLRLHPIFRGDRAHIHHRLVDRGLTPRGVVWVLYAAGGLAACISFLQSVPRNGAGSLGLALFSSLVCIGIQYLGYKEFAIAADLLWNSRLRSLVKSHVALRDHERSLQAAATVDECWRAVRQVGREFGFSYVALRLGGRTFDEQLERDPAPQLLLHIPLSESDHVRLMCKFELSGAGMVVAPLTDLLHRSLSAKTAEFGVRPSLSTRKPPAHAAGLHTREEGDYVRSIAPGA